MSRLRFTRVATPSTPASNKVELFVDTADRKLKTIDDNGVISVLNNDGLQDRNIITNGGFNIQQRIAVASTAIAGITTTTRGGVVADRWAVTTSVATNLNWQQVDAGGAPESLLNSRYYGSIISATAGKKVMLSQFIINAEMVHLRGGKVRVSVKTSQKVGSEGQTYKLGLIQLNSAGTIDVSPAFLSGAFSTVTGTDPAWGTNLAAITPDASPTGENGTIAGAYLEILSTLAWKRSSAVFTVPTNARNLVVVLFANATGGVTDNLSVAEFQLTQGPDIVDFREAPFDETVTRCQRFYNKSFALTTVPIQNAGINTGEIKAVAGKAGAVINSCIFAWRYPTAMFRTPPTVIIYNPAAANALGRNLTGVADLGATALTAQLDSSAMAISTGVAATAVGDQCGLHYTADAEIVT